MSRLDQLDKNFKSAADENRQPDYYFAEKDDNGKVINVFQTKAQYIDYLGGFLRAEREKIESRKQAEFASAPDESFAPESVAQPTDLMVDMASWLKKNENVGEIPAVQEDSNKDLLADQFQDKFWHKIDRIADDKIDIAQPEKIAIEPDSVLVEKIDLAEPVISSIVEESIKMSEESQPQPDLSDKDLILAEAYEGYRLTNEKSINAPAKRLKGWLDNLWYQLEKPFAGWKQAALELGNALYVPDKIYIYKFTQTLDRQFNDNCDQFDAALQVALISKFVEENRLKMDQRSYNELIDRKMRLVHGLDQGRYSREIIVSGSSEYDLKKARLAELGANAQRPNGMLADVIVKIGRNDDDQAEVAINFGTDPQMVHLTKSLMQTGAAEVMSQWQDNKLAYQFKQAKKAWATLGLTAFMLFAPYKLSETSEQSKDQSIPMKQRSKIVSQVNYQKAEKNNVALDAGEKELAQLVSWDSVKEIAVANNIYLDAEVKQFMTEDFAGEMQLEAYKKLALNHTNLMSENYEYFGQFVLVCKFYDEHKEFFQGHEENLRFLRNHPDLVANAQDPNDLLLGAVKQMGLNKYCLEMGIDYKLAKECVEFNPDLLKDGKALRVVLNNLDKSAFVRYSGANDKYSADTVLEEPVISQNKISSVYDSNDYAQVCDTVNQNLTVNSVDADSGQTSNESLKSQRELNKQAEYLSDLGKVKGTAPNSTVSKKFVYEDGGLVDEVGAEYQDAGVIAEMAVRGKDEIGGDAVAEDQANKGFENNGYVITGNKKVDVSDNDSQSFLVKDKTIEEKSIEGFCIPGGENDEKTQTSDMPESFTIRN